MGLNLVLQNFKLVVLVLIKKNSNSLRPSLKIGFNSMCMLTLLKTRSFIHTKLYNKLKIENCENVEFYNKLKPLTYLYSSAYL